jgi:exodeoxyribonuclease VII large subunit
MNHQTILQVSELTKKVKFLLESELNTVWLCGEISNFIAASSGHWYLSLKDKKSHVKCAMFKGSNRRVNIKPRNGQQVLVRAKVSLYEPRGDFQLILEMMDDAGDGLLRQQFDQLKQRLNVQGYFAEQNKQEIPTDIATVGIITSATGAAVKDILATIKRRNPLINTIIYPCLVQGELAKHEIADQIKTANQRNECQVLIIGRGGGSLEDLWPFNEEIVVEAIYHSQIPTISAVGHEIDISLSDYAADIRAATPTAAAELVSLDNSKIQYSLQQISKRLHRSIMRIVFDKRHQKESLQHRLYRTHPEKKLQADQQKVDDLSMRLSQATSHYLSSSKAQQKHLHHRLSRLLPLPSIKSNQQTNKQLEQRLKLAIQHTMKVKQQCFVHTIEQLQLVSPLATISRGYSVVRSHQGRIIKQLEQVIVNDNITIQVNDGDIEAKVINIKQKT